MDKFLERRFTRSQIQEMSGNKKSDGISSSEDTRKEAKFNEKGQQGLTEGDTVKGIMSEVSRILETRMDDMKQELLQTLNHKFDDLLAEINEVKKENKKMKDIIKEMAEEQTEQENRILCLENQLFNVEKSMIDNEQYHRRKSIRLFGIKEEKDENCEEIVMKMCEEKLNKTLSPGDLVSVHRITSNAKPRPIIAVFAKHDTKMEIMKLRKTLKGSGMVITEDLCKGLVQVLNRLKNDKRVIQSWSWDSKIFAKTRNGQVVRVEWGQSLDEALKK